MFSDYIVGVLVLLTGLFLRPTTRTMKVFAFHGLRTVAIAALFLAYCTPIKEGALFVS